MSVYLCVHISEGNALDVSHSVSGDTYGDISGVPFALAALRQEAIQIPRQLFLLECEQRPGDACRGPQI